jgi:hypothetical protein
MTANKEELSRYGLWLLAGATSCLAVLGAMSIGVLILPIAIALVVLAARRRPRWPAVLGLAPGLALPALVISFLHWRRCYSPQPNVRLTDGALVIRYGGCLEPLGNPTLLLILTGVAVAGVIAYGVACRRSHLVD